MDNLVGVKGADLQVRAELVEAGARLIRVPPTGEVQSILQGRIGNWKLSRQWYYWLAQTPTGEGLPLKRAVELHNKDYALPGNRIRAYGQVIRVNGDCGAPAPDNVRANHFDEEGFILILDPTGEEEERWEKMKTTIPEMRGTMSKYKFVKDLSTATRSTIDLYHIDTQIGLNEFVRTAKSALAEQFSS